MTPQQMQKAAKFVETHIDEFHNHRLEKLRGTNLRRILKRCNPYLYKVKNLEIAHDFVKTLLDDHLGQQGKTIFGNFLEIFAQFIGRELFLASPSSATGVDLEFERGGVHYLVSVKSSPNWGNSSAQVKQRENFVAAKRLIRDKYRKNKPPVQAVLGCCTGVTTERNYQQNSHVVLSGQAFWIFLSGDENLYTDIVKPLGVRAKEKNERYRAAYAKLLNQSTLSFASEFCRDGEIDWSKLVKFNSGCKDLGSLEVV